MIDKYHPVTDYTDIGGYYGMAGSSSGDDSTDGDFALAMALSMLDGPPHSFQDHDLSSNGKIQGKVEHAKKLGERDKISLSSRGHFDKLTGQNVYCQMGFKFKAWYDVDRYLIIRAVRNG